MYSPYDDVGQLGGLFAPAYIAGDPNSIHFASTPGSEKCEKNADFQ